LHYHSHDTIRLGAATDLNIQCLHDDKPQKKHLWSEIGEARNTNGRNGKYLQNSFHETVEGVALETWMLL
jgi:hypothetical protein